jgi:hypothetical protein
MRTRVRNAANCAAHRCAKLRVDCRVTLPQFFIGSAKDGQRSPTRVEPDRASAHVRLRQSQRTTRRWKSEKQPTRETKMDTLIVFGTACFIASYAMIVYRCLPQE